MSERACLDAGSSADDYADHSQSVMPLAQYGAEPAPGVSARRPGKRAARGRDRCASITSLSAPAPAPAQLSATPIAVSAEASLLGPGATASVPAVASSAAASEVPASAAAVIPDGAAMDSEDVDGIRRVLYQAGHSRRQMVQREAMRQASEATWASRSNTSDAGTDSDSDVDIYDFARASDGTFARWESDCDVSECRRCRRRFSLFVRKHHCRRCGRIFCDACSSHREKLSLHELIIDPCMPEMLAVELEGPCRVCDLCSVDGPAHENISDDAEAGSFLSHMLDYVYRTQPRVGATGDEHGHTLSDSTASVIDDCPVCGVRLASLRSTEEREQHLRYCLEHGEVRRSLNSHRYVSYTLTDDSPLLGHECIICMEDFDVGSSVARFSCLCCFHVHCADSWLRKGRGCPVHSSDP